MSLAAPSDSASGDSQASPEPPEPRRRDTGDPRRMFVAHNVHERIQKATARAVSTHGFADTTVQDICAEAQVSTEVFHEHFSSTQEATVSALEAGVDRVMQDLRETFNTAPDWPEAIWRTFSAYLEWFANEPAFGRLAVVEIMAAGEPALELMQSLMDTFAMFLEPGYELAPTKAPSRGLIDETVGNNVFGMLHEHITRESSETAPVLLPEMVRKVLTPFIGAEAATKFVAERRAKQ